MRFCKFCGQQISDVATFCEHCGKNLKDETLTDRKERSPEKLTQAELKELAGLEAFVARGVKMRTGLLVWGIILGLVPFWCLLNFIPVNGSSPELGWIGLVLSIGPAGMIIGAIVGYANQKKKVEKGIARIAEIKARRGY